MIPWLRDSGDLQSRDFTAPSSLPARSSIRRPSETSPRDSATSTAPQVREPSFQARFTMQRKAKTAHENSLRQLRKNKPFAGLIAALGFLLRDSAPASTRGR